MQSEVGFTVGSHIASIFEVVKPKVICHQCKEKVKVLLCIFLERDNIYKG